MFRDGYADRSGCARVYGLMARLHALSGDVEGACLAFEALLEHCREHRKLTFPDEGQSR